MAAGPRLDARGVVHHVIARGIERRRIFQSDRDRRDFLERLDRLVPACGVNLYAWSLMPNHVHLLVRRSGAQAIGVFMRRLLGGYALGFNRRHQRCGHLFQNRFKSVLVEEESYLLTLIRYIHLNPLRAEIVSNLEALERFPWTGYSVLMQHRTFVAQDTSLVTQLFATPAALREFMREGIGASPAEFEGAALRADRGKWRILEPSPRGRENWMCNERVLASKSSVQRFAATIETPPFVLTQLEPHAIVKTLCTKVAQLTGIPVAAIASSERRPRVVLARAMVCLVAVENCGLAMRRVAALLGISPASVLRGMQLAPSAFECLGCSVNQLVDRLGDPPWTGPTPPSP